MPTTVTHQQHRTEAQRIGWGGVVFFALLIVGVLDAQFLPPAFRVQMVFLALCGAVAWAVCFFFFLPAFFVPAPPARPSTSAPPRVLKVVERDSPTPPPVVAPPVVGSQLDVLLPPELRDVFVKPFTTLPPLTEFPDAGYEGFFPEMRKDAQRRSIVKTLTLSRQVKEEMAAGLKLARGASDDFYHTIENYLKASELQEDQRLRQKQREAESYKIDRDIAISNEQDDARRVARDREEAERPERLRREKHEYDETQADRKRKQLRVDAEDDAVIAKAKLDVAQYQQERDDLLAPRPPAKSAEELQREEADRRRRNIVHAVREAANSELDLKDEGIALKAENPPDTHPFIDRLIRDAITNLRERRK